MKIDDTSLWDITELVNKHGEMKQKYEWYSILSSFCWYEGFYEGVKEMHDKQQDEQEDELYNSNLHFITDWVAHQDSEMVKQAWANILAHNAKDGENL